MYSLKVMLFCIIVPFHKFRAIVYPIFRMAFHGNSMPPAACTQRSDSREIVQPPA